MNWKQGFEEMKGFHWNPLIIVCLTPDQGL